MRLTPARFRQFLGAGLIAGPPSFCEEKKGAEAPVFVIVGGGGAGVAAAETLRAEGFSGRVVVICKEQYPPYFRPQLSKDWSQPIKELYIHDEDFYREKNIELWLSSEVTNLDAQKKSIECRDGRKIEYDKALLCTGGRSRHLLVPHSELGKSYTLREPKDAEALRRVADKKGRVCVVGSSFIGMEAASVLAQEGAQVTVVGVNTVPYERALGKKVGAMFTRLLRENKVEFYNNARMKLYKGEDAVVGVELDDGEEVRANAVIVGAGIHPVTEFLNGVPLLDDGSIEVSPLLETSVKGLYAAGDIATFPYWRTGKSLRIEHWHVAQAQGRTAALNMLGRFKPYAAVPEFWTEVFGHTLWYVGYAENWEQCLIEGDLGKQNFVAYYCANDQVLAVCSMGNSKIPIAVKKLMQRNVMPKASEIIDGKVTSVELVGEARQLPDN